MKRFRFLLLDANIVIKLFELGIWENVLEKCDILLSRTVAENEAEFFFDDEGGQHAIDLAADTAAKRIEIVDVELAFPDSVASTSRPVMTEPNQTEALIAAAQRGDRLALASLLARFHRQLWARAEARLDPALKAKTDPDDILQEVYFDIARQIDRFEHRGPGSFLGWMEAILDQKVVNARRVAHRKVRDISREVPAEQPAADSCWNLLDRLCADSTTASRIPGETKPSVRCSSASPALQIRSARSSGCPF